MKSKAYVPNSVPMRALDSVVGSEEVYESFRGIEVIISSIDPIRTKAPAPLTA